MELSNYLGKKVVDRITGRKGVCIGVVHWLYGCDEALVEIKPKKRELNIAGYRLAAEKYPMQRLKVTGDAIEAYYPRIDQDLLTSMLGKKVKDKMTGIKGICTCIRYDMFSDPMIVILICEKGKPKSIEHKMIDAVRVEVIGDGIDPAEVQGEDYSHHGGGELPDEDFIDVI